MQKIKPRTVNPPHLDDVYISVECNIFYKVFFFIYTFFPIFFKRNGNRQFGLVLHCIRNHVHVYIEVYMFAYFILGYFATRIFWYVSI